MNHGVTLESLQMKKEKGQKITALTAYDFSTARILDQAGLDIILVGDSLGMVVLGYPDTLKVTLSDMIYHTSAVRRGVSRSMVIADMPFLSYGASDELTVINAGRLIQEGGAVAVKLEGGKEFADVIRKMVRIGIPVLAHVGMLPTHILAKSGYHVQGKNAGARQAILEDALALEEAGVFAIVLECVQNDVAKFVTSQLRIPTIGIGSGPNCDGQILVGHDVFGLYDLMKPKFVKRYANLDETMGRAAKAYKDEVEKGVFPGKENTYL